MPIINGIFTKDFPDLGRDLLDSDIIVIAVAGNDITYKSTVGALRSIIGTPISGTSDSDGNFDVSGFSPSSTPVAWSAFDNATGQDIPVSYNKDTMIMSGFGASQAFTGRIV